MRRSDHGGGRVGVWDEWSRVRIARESWDDGVEGVVNGEIGDRVQSCLDERRQRCARRNECGRRGDTSLVAGQHRGERFLCLGMRQSLPSGRYLTRGGDGLPDPAGRRIRFARNEDGGDEADRKGRHGNCEASVHMCISSKGKMERTRRS